MKQNYFPFHWFFLIVLVVLGIALPFADKPFHIDDAFVLKIADNILQNPGDPFAGEFDWMGSTESIFETTTNPPLISYYLAPFIARFGVSEIALHCAMMVFLLMIAWGMVVLSHRFAGGSMLPLLFVMFSPAVMVSGNVMRDIPAAGLAVAAIAFFVMGTDKENRFYLFCGGVLAGLAMLTKYSAIIVIPVLLLYPLFKRKLWVWKWTVPALLLLLVWCLQNIAMYDRMHIVFLTLNRRTEAGIPWTDKACGALVILGSMIYLLPALIWCEAKRHRWIVFAGCLPVGLATLWAIERQFAWEIDGQYLFWALGGGLLLYLCLAEGIRRGVRYVQSWGDDYAGDSLFLLAWLCAPILFSILFIPFQAVRHQILALPPLVLLAWRAIYRTHKDCGFVKLLVIVILLLQATVSYLVTTVDYQFASSYPMMARYAKEKYSSKDHQTWFVGHWGWKVYAEREGFRMRHRGGDLPKPGDIVLWPVRVHSGDVWGDLKNESVYRIFESEPLEEIEYMSPLPLRNQNFQGASFYAVIGNNIPYRFFQDIDLETLKVYRVKPYKIDDVMVREDERN